MAGINKLTAALALGAIIDFRRLVLVMADAEFVATIEEALKDKGILDNLSCQVRVEILQLLKSPLVTKEEKKPVNSANFIVNELIKEYLDYNGYKHTSDILSVESGQPQKRAQRNDVEATLNVHTGPNAKHVPLIYSIVSQLRNQNCNV